jgi:iron complex outermembrane recepter protein
LARITTAGAFNISTRAARFKPGANFEISYGNYGFIQAKASVTGALTKKIAGRLSFSGTQRHGVLTNIITQKPLDYLNNIGVRGQLLFVATSKLKLQLPVILTTKTPMVMRR